MALLLLAGLSLVPDELLRAAKVDGATAWQRFWRVMVPVMKPAILVALLFRTLDAFRIFDNIYILTQGSQNTRSVSILNYDQLFTALNLGVGSAMSVLIFIAVALIAFTFIKGFGAAAPGQEAGAMNVTARQESAGGREHDCRPDRARSRCCGSCRCRSRTRARSPTAASTRTSGRSRTTGASSTSPCSPTRS